MAISGCLNDRTVVNRNAGTSGGILIVNNGECNNIAILTEDHVQFGILICFHVQYLLLICCGKGYCACNTVGNSITYLAGAEIYNIPADKTVTYIVCPYTVSGDTVTYGIACTVTFPAAD